MTLALAQYGLRHGVDIEVNWLGRLAVFPIMAAIFFAMVFDGWVPTALLIFGLVLAIAGHGALRPHGPARRRSARRASRRLILHKPSTFG